MSEEPWHLDKRVPVALIFAMGLQLFAIGWWNSRISSDVESLKISDVRQDVVIEKMSNTANDQAVQLGRIEEIAKATQRSVETLARDLERP